MVWVRIESHADVLGAARPLIETRFTVLDSVTGACIGEDSVRYVGSTPNSAIAVACSHSPDLAVGREYVLFLWRADVDQKPGLLGMSHGCYAVEQVAGEEVVRGLHADNEGLASFWNRILTARQSEESR